MALLYELLLLLAVFIVFGAAFQGAASAPLTGWPRHLFQMYLFLLTGLYFIWCWVRGGQTLAMKTWKIKLENTKGGAVSPSQALARYLLAWISLLAGGLGFLWAFLDRDRQFLHDRMAATRIVSQDL